VPSEKAREWAPRLWEGLDYFAFWRLMVRNRFAVEPPYWHIAAIMSCTTFLNTVFRMVQEAGVRDRLDGFELPADPVFVLGHWRTGTTLLHELLTLDDQFSTPTTHDCFNPCHFLLGEPSTYTDIAFPNRPPLDPGALDLSGLSAVELRHWKRTLLKFVKTLALRDPRPLLLKSPPHTARIPELLDLFPSAKFVHIRRDPLVLYSSTMKLWQSLAASHGLQTPRGGPPLEAKVLREFRVMMTRYLATKDMIPAGNLVEVRYEDLVRDLPAGVAAIYQGLNLGDYDRVRPKVEEYAARTRDYATNRFTLTPEQETVVRSQWGDLIERLGY
jgi:hypothetical protein